MVKLFYHTEYDHTKITLIIMHKQQKSKKSYKRLLFKIQILL